MMFRSLRVLCLFSMLFLLAGCYRPAGDEFSEDTSAQNLPTQNNTVITLEPDENTTPIPFESTATLDSAQSLPTRSGTVIPLTLVNQTPTRSIPTLLPTATTAGSIITPEQPIQQQFSTATQDPLVTPDPLLNTGNNSNALGFSTPTDLPYEISSECIYTVQPGDTLFRIATNNNVTVDALKATNSMVNDLIHVGDELVIPDCVDQSNTGTDNATSLAPEGSVIQPGQPVGIGTPQTNLGGNNNPSGQQIHIVQPGESLMIIAQKYGTTIKDIAAANNISNIQLIRVGQELVIPAVP